MKLPEELWGILAFSVPGVVANHVRFSVSNLPSKRDEWQVRLQFILFSLVGWSILYLVVIATQWVVGRQYGVSIDLVPRGVYSVPDVYGHWLWPEMLCLNVVLGFLVGLCDNCQLQERFTNPIRVAMRQMPENRRDVWNRLIVTKAHIYVKVCFVDGYVLWGQVLHASSKDEERCLYLSDTAVHLHNSLLTCLPKPEGTYIDLNKGYTIEVYDGDEFAKNLTAFMDRQDTEKRLSEPPHERAAAARSLEKPQHPDGSSPLDAAD